MLNSRVPACMLLAMLVAVLPAMHALKVEPSDDGMSLSGIFHAKLEALHAKHMRGEIGKDVAPVAPEKGKPPPPPPPSTTPCFEGGDDCTDYDSTFDPCTKYTCNRDERRCMPEPREEFTPCGVDGDYYFGVCNQGPGFCRVVESKFGDFGICMGFPKLGNSCNDYDYCTKDDRCTVVVTDNGLFRGQCMGKFDADATCSDYDDRCTTNDRCQLVSTDEGDVPVCRGDVTEGETCNDYNQCSVNDQCISITPRFTFDSGARCRGSLATGMACNDYNMCTNDDVCTELPDNYGDYGTFITCRGETAVGQSCESFQQCIVNPTCQDSDYGYAFCGGEYDQGGACDDYNECTTDDICVPSFYGNDYTFCEGTPAVGIPCNDYDDCSTNDVCIEYTNDYVDRTFAFCQGEPTSGNTCNDYNDCTTGDTCVLGDSGDYSFCEGTPEGGLPCNDYNDCTTGGVCVLGDYGDFTYSFCEQGEPTIGEPCSDFSDYTSGDVCVASDYGGVFCQGEFGAATVESATVTVAAAPVAADTNATEPTVAVAEAAEVVVADATAAV